jgi:hypothetical protein
MGVVISFASRTIVSDTESPLIPRFLTDDHEEALRHICLLCGDDIEHRVRRIFESDVPPDVEQFLGTLSPLDRSDIEAVLACFSIDLGPADTV